MFRPGKILETRRITRMSLVSVLGISVLSMASPALADLKSEVETKLVDTQKKAAPDLVVGKATCPATMTTKAGKVAAGVYRCSVIVEGVAVPYDVTVRTGGAIKSGSYLLQNAKAVIDTKKLVSIASSAVDDPAKAKITCGKARVIVVEPGAKLTCTVVDGKTTDTLTFAVQDLRGVVSLIP